MRRVSQIVLASVFGLVASGGAWAVQSAPPAAALPGVSAAKPLPALVYPVSKRGEVVDEYFGVKVADPYRWLEDDNAPETKSWVTDQNAVTFAYLAAIPRREEIKNSLTKIWNYERFSPPAKEGGKYFFSRNNGLQPQSVLFVADALNAEPRVLLDPNTYRNDGTVSLAGTVPNEQGTLLAYGIADAGSDWSTWRVRDTATGQDLADEIRWVKFSRASWTKDGQSFVYTRFAQPPEGKLLTQVNEDPMFYMHTVGTTQDKDVLLYSRPDEPRWGLGGGVTEDGKYLIVSVSEGTDRKNRLFYRDLAAGVTHTPTNADKAIRQAETAIRAARDHAAKLAKNDKASDSARKAVDEGIAAAIAARTGLVASNGNSAHGFIELLTAFDASYDFIGNLGPVFYFLTDNSAPRQRLIAIDTRAPDRGNWKEIIPQTDATLTSVRMTGGSFIASYLRDARSEVKVFSYQGKLIREVQLPGIGTASGFGGRADDTETFYTFSGFTMPPAIFRYDVESGASEAWKTAKVDFDPARFETKQEFFTSKDGTSVPMFIVSRKGISLDGNNPTLLYGYGGFNISSTPGFSPANIVWMEMGGIYAVANIRGGGEYGESWHKAGTKLKKQNSFDDFIGAAEHLIARKYTRPTKLAIQGGSNGGLLVGACMAQRPELFGAALPAVGVMDMLRFHLFTIGWAWKSDYGSSENEAEFKVLNAYSPYHQMLRKTGVRYPSTMVTTGDHDDRVVPGHSFKFAAALQAAHKGENPALIRIEVRAGHGAGTPTEKRIQQAADTYAFLSKELGMNAGK